MAIKKTPKRPSLKVTVDKLVAIAERHLAKLPEEEQEARVEAFSKVVFKPSRGISAKPSSKPRIRDSRASARGHA